MTDEAWYGAVDASLTWRTWRLRHRREQAKTVAAGWSRKREEERAWEGKNDQTIKRWKCRILARMSVGVAQCGRLDADECEKEGERKRVAVTRAGEVWKEWRNKRLPTAGPVDEELTLVLQGSGAPAVPGRLQGRARDQNTASRHSLGAPIHWARAGRDPAPQGNQAQTCFPRISKSACATGNLLLQAPAVKVTPILY